MFGSPIFNDKMTINQDENPNRIHYSERLPLPSAQFEESGQSSYSSDKHKKRKQIYTSRRRRRPNSEICADFLGQLLILLVIVCQLTNFAGGQTQRHERRSTDETTTKQQQAKGSFCQAHTVGQQLAQQQQQQQQQHQSDYHQHQTKKVFCFYDIQDDFRPQDLNPCLCTHVVYSYVAVRKNLSFIAGKKGDLRSLATLKRKNPNLKLLVSLRPDDFFSFEQTSSNSTRSTNDTSPIDTTISSTLLTDQTGAPTTPSMNEMHQKFARRIRDFIVRHSLDGINLDWPYFAQTMSSSAAGRQHLTLTLEAINENFRTSLAQSSPSAAYLRLLQAPLVTLTTSKDFYSLVDGYNFHALNKLVDFVHLPAFDFDLNVDQFSIGHPARLHGIFDAENLDTLVDLLLSSGLPSSQLIAGLPSHGVQITSKLSGNDNAINSTNPTTDSNKMSSLDEQLEAAANISIVSHSEVCRVRELAHQNCTAKPTSGQSSCWTMSRSRDLTAPFVYDSEHWIGFDDETSIKLKAKYILLRHLAGAAMFTVNQDDPSGSCGLGQFPLLSVVNTVFTRAAANLAPPSTSSGSLVASSNQEQVASSNQRALFTRAPNQLLTATSLVSQIFGNKLASSSKATTPTASGDLMQSASDEVAAAGNANQLTSFVDIIEKFGSVRRLDARGQLTDDEAWPAQAGHSNAADVDDDPDRQLACDKIGYQRYPRDCSRFYRCVQTPPLATGSGATQSGSELGANKSTSSSFASTTITRLQYECPSGLVFDEQYQICNWPSWSAQCTGSGEVNSITNSKFVCPNYGYFQNQENCEYFYYCSDYSRNTTQAYQFRCPFELGFDEEKLQCNWKWLVRGCNVTSSSSSSSSFSISSSGNSTGSSNTELAQKYLASLESKTITTTLAPTVAPITTQQHLSATSSMPPAESTEKPATISRRSLELETAEKRDEPASGRGFTASLGSHMTSFLASIAAVREHRIKKANAGSSLNNASGNNKNKNSVDQATAESSTGSTPKQIKYPTFIGLPQFSSSDQANSPSPIKATTSSFRLRRRQQTPSSSDQQLAAPTQFEGDKLQSVSVSVSASTPYKRRPPPASMFSFLPNSAVYMLVDSIRSVGEAAGDEINRYIRLAGDRVRDVLGTRPTSWNQQVKLKHKQKRRSDDKAADSALESTLAKFAAKFSSGGSIKRLSVQNLGLVNQFNYHSLELDEDQRRSRRTKRAAPTSAASAVDEMDGDLEALESAPANQQVYVAPPSQQVRLQQVYKDPLGLPAGYPLNPLDDVAKRAVLGAEPKMFSQPSHVMLNQMTAISQADYERLIRNQRPLVIPAQPGSVSYLQQQQQQNSDPMMSAASEQVGSSSSIGQLNDRNKVIDRIIEHAREAFTVNQGEQASVVPFGMPAMIQRPSTKSNANSQDTMQTSASIAQSSKQKRRSTVAMKLATLALPKFNLLPTTTTASSVVTSTSTSTSAPLFSQSGGEAQKSSNKYMSFLPSFSDVVVAPARNIMNKAMGFNRAVQDLISTLAPGSSSATKQQQQTAATNPTAPPKLPQVLANEQQLRLASQNNFQQHAKPFQTTPMPFNNNINQYHQQQHQQQRQQQLQQMNNNHPQQQMMNANNKIQPNGPLLLTENEARALSAQLDQLSKEQLEALAAELFKGQDHNQNGVPNNQMQPQTTQRQPNEQRPTRANAATESPDYVMRLLKMLSQTSHNPEDVRLLDQLASQLNNPRPNGQDQSLIEIGQPDDLALLEALGIIPSSMQQRPAGLAGSKQIEIVNGTSSGQQADNRPEASYSNIQQVSMNDLYQHQGGFKHGSMKPLLQHRQPQHGMQQSQHDTTSGLYNLELASRYPAIEIEHNSDDAHSGTTKYVPIAIELTTPMPYHESSYNNYYTPTTTTTTTTTLRPTQLVQQVFQNKLIESQVPPVKQTFTELIENNVTTPDGIETSIESRTKTAISGGASFGIGSQVGLGMIPSVFGGSVPMDSPMAEQQALDRAKEAEIESNKASNSSNSTTSTANDTSSALDADSKEEKTKKNGTQVGEVTIKKPSSLDSAVSIGGIKGAANQQQLTNFGSFANSNFNSNSGLDEAQLQFQADQQNDGQRVAFSNSFDQSGQAGQFDFGQAAANGEANFAFGNQQRGFTSTGGIQGARTLVSSQMNQVLQQDARQPLTSGQTSTSFSSAQAPGGTLASLAGYNFAMQPINQMEEVVVKKKFKPFPKKVMMPQESSFMFEEVRSASNGAANQLGSSGQISTSTANRGQQQGASSSSFEEQQQSVSATNFNESQGNLSSASLSSSSSSSSSTGAAASAMDSIAATATDEASQQQQQIKEDEFSTVASTFGETMPTPAAEASSSDQASNSQTNSMTRLELQNEQQIASDLRNIELQLQQQDQSRQQMNPTGEIVDVPLTELVGSSSVGSDGLEREQLQVANRLRSAGRPKKSRKGQNQNKQTSSATSATTTTTSTSTTPAPGQSESSTQKRSIGDNETLNVSSTTRAPGSRVEEAFSNFMVELKRSRKPPASDKKKETMPQTVSTTSTTTTTTSTTTTTTTTSKPEAIESASSEQRGQSRRKSRSKKARHGQRISGRNDLDSASSSRSQTASRKPVGSQETKRATSTKKPSSSSNQNRAKQAKKKAVKRDPIPVQQRQPSSQQHEQVAIYGTKSGFMPIIKPDDPSYAEIAVPSSGNQLDLQLHQADPLSFSASFASSKRQSLDQIVEPEQIETVNRRQKQAKKLNRKQSAKQTDGAWQNYFGRHKLSDQISVVHLGNFSEQIANHTHKVIQVKLVIVPSAPNNLLLNVHNWHHLASSFPALFPMELTELNVEPVELGRTSINLQNGGLIDEQLEQARHQEFKLRYKQVSELIEPSTFKALDEIIQRSSGQLFMLQRRDSLDRTLIALIPDRPFIRSAMAPAGGYQRQVGHQQQQQSQAQTLQQSPSSTPATISTTASRPETTAGSTAADTIQLRETTPQKAATFSRAIQESIQEAIRQHYDTMKSQLRQSMEPNSSGEVMSTSAASSGQRHWASAVVTPSSSNGDEQYNRQRNWSTPPADLLARLESVPVSNSPAALSSVAPPTQQDPMEAAGSSTEYSLAVPTESMVSVAALTSSYSSQSLYEVEGAEPKTLYGLSLNPAERQNYEQVKLTGSDSSNSSEPTTFEFDAVKTNQQQLRPASSPSRSSRFISIGSHLIASPMKKIVDQAYVNHFYDHIGDHQLAKSIGFDDQQTDAFNETQAEDTNQTTAKSNGVAMGSTAEESLVPESACTRAGLFQHPFACNKFYECFWDKQMDKFTLHMFECPIKLAFDDRIVGCAMPIESSLCVNM